MTAYSFEVNDIEGNSFPLSAYEGKVSLIVNTASRCGFTPQYEGLQRLYEEYKDKGLVILGFPSNDFGSQEPGSNAEIKKFCEVNYDISFPLFEKGPVKGASTHPLFKYLTANATPDGEIEWNFEKFLVNREGEVVARFRSSTEPGSQELKEAIEALI